MDVVHSDLVVRVPPGTTPDYNHANPLLRLLGLLEAVELAGERELYHADSLQYLFPFEHLELYGPSAPQTEVLDPRQQDVKTDFQKQNVAGFRTGDVHLVRGLITVGSWSGTFLRLSYRGGPDSRLSAAAGHGLGAAIRLWLKVGARESGALLTVPYNEVSDRYEVELWGYPAADLAPLLDVKARGALARGEIQLRPDLVPGSVSDFQRERVSELHMIEVAPENAMHPVLPLHIEAAWADAGERVWDSLGGANHHYEFNMVVRGWENYLGVGISPNPHGGVGFLEYRNLLSNYGRYAARRELGRVLEPWNLDAFGTKSGVRREEPFFAVDYADLHILKPGCGIGLHRHRDNQEIFLMLEGRGLMVVGDWAKLPQRERCFEVRTLRPGELAMLKGGNLHGLMNSKDEDAFLFMFGGYD